MAKVKTFKTIFPAVSVPLNDDYSINEKEFREYLRWIKTFYGKGIEGLVCNGHTGEITGLSRAERKRVTEICAEECGDVMTIISGVNCENTIESIEMAKEAKEAGADGILLMPPHMWLRFGMHPDAPFEYIKDVAEGADIDIIIHLYPATSKAFYPVETLIKMCKEIEHVKCIKVGTRVTAIYEHDVRLLRQECPDISLITCHDETLCVTWFPGMDGALGRRPDRLRRLRARAHLRRVGSLPQSRQAHPEGSSGLVQPHLPHLPGHLRRRPALRRGPRPPEGSPRAARHLQERPHAPSRPAPQPGGEGLDRPRSRALQAARSRHEPVRQVIR